MSTVKIDYCGMEGEGRNLTAAKQDAARKLTVAMEGSYNPTIIAFRGYAILVYREPHGWCNRIIADHDFGVRNGTVYGSPNHATKNAAVQEAYAHLAQLVWKHEDGVNLPAELLPDFTREMIADFRTWARFQLLSASVEPRTDEED